MRTVIPVYRGAEMQCPNCGRSHWLVGRMLTQCAFCADVVLMPTTGFIGASANRVSKGLIHF